MVKFSMRNILLLVLIMCNKITLALWRQIHYMENGSVEVYSRNAEWNTGKFPDVVAAVSR